MPDDSDPPVPTEGTPGPPPDRYEVVEDPGAPRASRVPSVVYRRLFEASTGYDFVLDDQGAIVDYCEAVSELAGPDGPRSLLGRRLHEAPWWDDPDRVEAAVGTARGGQTDRFVTPVRKGGQSLLLRVEAQPVEGPDGAGWIAVEARDETQLAQSERQLRMALGEAQAERRRLQAVLDAAEGFVAAVDHSGRLAAANTAWAEWTAGLTGRDVEVNDDVRAALEPEHPALAELWDRALSGETSATRLWMDGTDQWVDVSFASIRASSGRVLGAVVVGHDVSDRIEAERLRAGLQGSGVGTFAVDPTSRTVRLSDELRDLLALGPDASTVALDAAFARVRDPAAAVEAVERAARGDGLDLVVELDAPPRSVRLRGRHVGGVPARVVGVAYDVTGTDQAQAADDRWLDLIGRARWGARAPVPAERVSTDADPEEASSGVLDPDRLAALRQTGLLDTAPTEAFDILTRLVSQALGVPISLVSLVDEDRQYFKSAVGLPGAVAASRETPLSHSFCQYVASERRPLVVDDALEAPLVRENRAVRDLSVRAYLGVPVAAPDGHVVGSLCAIDTIPRAWTEEELRLLSSLAEVASAEIALHQRRAEGDEGA